MDGQANGKALDQSQDSAEDGTDDWRCEHFGLTLDEDQVPEILRRVASEIEAIDGFRLLNVVVQTDGDEATASVYYWRSED